MGKKIRVSLILSIKCSLLKITGDVYKYLEFHLIYMKNWQCWYYMFIHVCTCKDKCLGSCVSEEGDTGDYYYFIL